MLLEQQLLHCEIMLGIEEVAAATSSLSLRMLASTVDREASIGPKATLVNDLSHTLEPLWIIGVVIWEVK